MFFPETFNFSIIVLIFLKKWFFVEKTFLLENLFCQKIFIVHKCRFCYIKNSSKEFWKWEIFKKILEAKFWITSKFVWKAQNKLRLEWKHGFFGLVNYSFLKKLVYILLKCIIKIGDSDQKIFKCLIANQFKFERQAFISNISI